MSEDHPERRSLRPGIELGKWHHVVVKIAGQAIMGYINDELSMKYTADRSLGGYVGLWIKSDSVTCFDELVIEMVTKIRSSSKDVHLNCASIMIQFP